MDMECETAVPYTLLVFLLRGGDGGCGGGWRAVAAEGFLTDYVARGKNALLWVGLISVTFLLLRKLGKLLRFWVQGSRIPGPPSPSFFGHSKLIADCGTGGDLTGYLSMMHEKYGPIVRLWLGPTQMLVSVKDLAVIKEMLVKAEDKLPLIGRSFRLAFGSSTLFVSPFDKVQKTRESLAAYMNDKLLHRMNQIPTKVVQCVIGKIDSIMMKNVSDSRSISQQMAFYILGATIFGDTFWNWPNALLYEDLLVTVAKEACYWASYRIPPFWRRAYWRYQFLCTKLKGLNQDIVEECKQNKNVSNKRDQIHNEMVEDASLVMDNTLFNGSLFPEKANEDCISKEEQCSNILGMMFHGFLTMASLINNIFTRLVLHPELQEKVYVEITSLKKTSEFEPLSVGKMKLLLATMYESARLLPPGPFLQRCSIKNDLILNSSIAVPAGAILVVSLPLVHMDQLIWGKDACQFDPRHFLPKACKSEGTLDEHEFSKDITDEPCRDGSFLSFGSGARSCVGQKYTILGLASLFASLLYDYEIRLQPGSDTDPKPATTDECHLRLQPSPKIVFAKRIK